MFFKWLLLFAVLALFHTRAVLAKSVPLKYSWPEYEEADKRRCIFIHGSGMLTDGPVTTTFEEYWGNIHEFTPQCSSWEFNHADTVTQLFDSPKLMKDICSFAVGSNSDSGLISNTIVFTHSMGGLIFGAALRNSICSIDFSSSTWYDAAGPFRGSKGANFIDQLCENRSLFAKPIQWIAEKMHYCVEIDQGPPNNAYLSMQTSYPGLVGLADFVAQMVNGTMCGDSAAGLFSKYSVAFEAVEYVVQYGEPNDGMVAVSSCFLADPSKYEKDFKADYYLAKVNHADSTCRNGNGDYDTAERNPCSWYSYRT